MRLFPNIVGYDLLPESEGIIECNIFNNSNFTKDNIVVGNPPFGTNASMAINIFNHIANYEVKSICFILPKTFKKTSVHNRLNLNYHLVMEQELVSNSFTVNGEDKDVPCVFQIWEYRTKKRIPKEEVVCKWISFVSKDEGDIAVRRAGSKAGKVLDGLNHSKTSTYFIKIHHPLVIKAIKLIDLNVVNHTAGVRSISKSELCNEINKVMEVLI